MWIDGKKIASEIQAEIAQKISTLRGRKPGLAILLVGHNSASEVYVRAKKKACAAIGIVSFGLELPSTISESDLLDQIEELNRRPEVDGILVQLPLPPHIDPQKVTAAIDPAKDVDAFHPINVGKMLLGEEGGFLPCTPHGIKILLEKSHIPVEGKHVVIVGRSNIVGKPLAALLMQKKPHCNATVTVAHSQSEHLSSLTRSADILVAALGRPLFIKKEMVKPKATVIDVGIHRLPEGKLVGDVDFAEVSPIAHAITPVPGGVGPMTIAMLLQNTLSAFLKIWLLLFCLVSCQKSGPKNSCTLFEGTAMSMPYQVTIGKNLSELEKNSVASLVETTFQQVHEIFDNENPDSEISRLNNAAAHVLIPLSTPLQDLLNLCTKMVQLSGHLFDPTVDPLCQLWRASKHPSPEALQKACDALGWEHLSLQNGIAKKDHATTRLGLSKIAKGFGIDWIAERLQAIGLTDFKVEWAGNLRALGHHPDNRDWTVAIDPHLTQSNQPLAPIHLRNAALATRGNQNRSLIDPRTASPLEKGDSAIASATVIAPTCALADALATTALLFHSRADAEKWAQEVVELYPEVSFWILSYNAAKG